MFNITHNNIHQCSSPLENNMYNLVGNCYHLDGGSVVLIWPDASASSRQEFKLPLLPEQKAMDFAINKLKELSFEFFIWCQENNL